MSATILVVDDHPLVLQVVQSMLTAAGYRVLAAADGPSGLRLFDQHRVDATLVDVDMPGMNGPEVCREIARRASEQGRTLVQWIMTGVVRPELALIAPATGVVGVLSKPFTRAELIACFEKHGVLSGQPAYTR